MKYVVVHGTGLVAPPLDQLGGRTPLQAATTPFLDRILANGAGGMVAIATDGAGAPSDLVHFAILGYDAQKYYPGPGPFEAAGLGVVLGEGDVAFLCSMVTLVSGGKEAVKKLAPHVVMDGPMGDDIETEQARELIDAVNEQLGSETIQFYPGKGDRHVMVWVGGKARSTCVSPGDAAGKPIGESLPRGDGSDLLRQLMEASLVILRDHPVNEERRDAGLKPANCLWLWGQGRWPKVPSLTDRYQIIGSIVSMTDLHKGVGACAGLEALETAAEGSLAAETALRELEKKPFVYVHVSSAADASDSRDSGGRLRFIEAFDRETVGSLLQGLEKLGPHRVLAICDSAGTSTAPGQGVSALYALYEGPSSNQASPNRRFADLGAVPSQGRSRDATKLLGQLFRKPVSTEERSL